MSRPVDAEIAGLWLPRSKEPRLFKADARYTNAQGRYLDACQMMLEGNDTPPVQHLRQRTDILLKNFRWVTRAILAVPDDEVEQSLQQFSNFVITEDTKRVSFLRDLTEKDDFPYTAERKGGMDAWIEEQYILAADDKDFEGQLVAMVSIFVHDNNHTLSEILGFKITT